jgi:histidinol-phosphate aminotransferase
MREKFDRLGIEYIPTFTNFILLLFPSEEFAATFNNECLNRGLILRPVNSFGILNGIRINSGTEEETEFALEVIEQAYSLTNEYYQVDNI